MTPINALTSSLRPLMTQDLSQPATLKNIIVQADTLSVANFAASWFNRIFLPTEEEKNIKLSQICQAITTHQSLFTEANLSSLSPEEKKRLYHNLQTLENQLSATGSHLPRHVKTVTRNLQLTELYRILEEKFFFYFDKAKVFNADRPERNLPAPKNTDELYHLIFVGTTPLYCERLKALLEAFPALQDVSRMVEVRESLTKMENQLDMIHLPTNVLDGFSLEGQNWMIYAPKAVIARDKSNVGDSYKQFLGNIENRCDLVINLMEMYENVETLQDKQERNYIFELAPLELSGKLSTEQKLEIFDRDIRNEAIRQIGYRTLVFGYPGNNPKTPRILHFDGLQDGPWNPLNERQMMKLLREIKSHLRYAQTLATEKDKSLQDLRILAHCRQGLNRTPFYIALFSFMQHSDWVIGKTDEEIINKFLSLLHQLARTPQEELSAGKRLPLPSYVREFCRPEFLAALREVIGPAPVNKF